MKIVYFADGEWAHEAFDRILDDQDFSIVKVVLRYDSSDRVLREKAEKEGIEVEAPQNVNSEQFVEEIRSSGADLGVSMSYNQILKKNLINVFPKGIINCHAGKLPNYRGRNVLNWALISGEKEIGVTCHYVDEDIDTGDIILQETFAVTADDDYGTVLEKSIDLCPKVLLESLHLIEEGKANPKPQAETGTYFIKRKEGDEFIDWDWPSERIYNFVRGITDPGPNARTWIRIDDQYYLLFIKEVNVLDKASAYISITGGVMGRSKVGNPLVKTGDTFVELVDYRIDHEEKNALAIGDRLGINFNLEMLQKYRERDHGKISKESHTL